MGIWALATGRHWQFASAPSGKSVLRVPVDDDFELTDDMRAALIAQQIDGAVLPDVALLIWD